MKVLMLKDVRGVGQRDTIQDVADGYALNFLIANGVAVQATPAKLAEHEARRKKNAISTAEKEKEYAETVKRLRGARVVIKAKANETGHLYRQLSSEMVAEGVRESVHITVPPDAIMLKEAVKNLGEFEAEVRLGQSAATFKISVVKDGK